MRYEEFKAAWDEALREVRLPGCDRGEETLDSRSMERRYQVYIEPLGGQQVKPFYVTAKLSWRLELGADRAKPEHRGGFAQRAAGARALPGHGHGLASAACGFTLRATTPYGKPLPMLAKSVWAGWVREAMGRLERIEPVIPEENVREADDGMLEILAWRGDPDIEAVCGADGERS